MKILKVVSLALVLTFTACGKDRHTFDHTDGIPGQAGKDAVPCTVTAKPEGVQISCPDGTTQTVLNGLTGAKGDTGAPGSDAHSPYMVKLCHDDTSTYPEYAEAVYNASTASYQLFAVYWGPAPSSGGQKTAFLAYIVPGAYSSTGGNGCSFNVNSDGSVSP